MKNKKIIKIGFAVGLVSLFILSLATPMAVGYYVTIRKPAPDKIVNEIDFLDRYNKYNASEITPDDRQFYRTFSLDEAKATRATLEEKWCGMAGPSSKTPPIGSMEGSGLMDSAWPMYCHDVRHTGRSPYSTADTTSSDKWRFETKGWATSSPAVDNDKNIYIGSKDFYAVYLNGTLKWKYDTGGVVESCCPAIDESGVIYVGTAYAVYGEFLYALHSNGTLKWKYETSNIFSSPVIGSDGTIYFADSDSHCINALYPNGTLRWKYTTNHVIYSSPAIGEDGTIYCGSHDGYVYALYPNGTLRWKYNTGSWVHGSPTIGDDGTVYIGSDDKYLYALYPNNGTMKWRINIGAVYASPAIDEDGTLYVGVWEKKFYAIYSNGTIKWSFNPGNRVWDSSAAIGAEGTIYFGTCDLETHGGEDIIALNPDGTEKWRKKIGTLFSSPAIGGDGTVYIGASGMDNGCLYAFGIGELEAGADGPYYGLIDEPVQFQGSSKGGYRPYSWFWDFGDGNTSTEQNATHIYANAGNYTVILTVTDNSSNQSSDTSWAWIQTSNDPPNRPTITGETNGNVGESYDYTFLTTDPEGLQVWYYIDWGDGSNTGWLGPYNNGQTITRSHTWSVKGIYNISCKAKDPYDAEGPWGYLEVEMPVNINLQNSQMQSKSQQSKNSMLLFQILEKIMNYPLSGC